MEIINKAFSFKKKIANGNKVTLCQKLTLFCDNKKNFRLVALLRFPYLEAAYKIKLFSGPFQHCQSQTNLSWKFMAQGLSLVFICLSSVSFVVATIPIAMFCLLT
jgi:hypothetical protein